MTLQAPANGVQTRPEAVPEMPRDVFLAEFARMANNLHLTGGEYPAALMRRMLEELRG